MNDKANDFLSLFHLFLFRNTVNHSSPYEYIRAGLNVVCIYQERHKALTVLRHESRKDEHC